MCTQTETKRRPPQYVGVLKKLICAQPVKVVWLPHFSLVKFIRKLYRTSSVRFEVPVLESNLDTCFSTDRTPRPTSVAISLQRNKAGNTEEQAAGGTSLVSNTRIAVILIKLLRRILAQSKLRAKWFGGNNPTQQQLLQQHEHATIEVQQQRFKCYSSMSMLR